jgi:hypothetical protein
MIEMVLGIEVEMWLWKQTLGMREMVPVRGWSGGVLKKGGKPAPKTHTVGRP